jgi:hypothetical protein
MIEKITKGVAVLVLVAAVLTGAYQGFIRHRAEREDRTVELVVDLNDLKKIAAFEKKPLGPILAAIRKIGIAKIGVFEETLPDASAMGELYYAKGSGILRLKSSGASFFQKGRISAERTYIYIPEKAVRERVYYQLRLILGEGALRFLGKEVIEVDEAEEELRDLGLGISAFQKSYLESKGFSLVPRLWNDPRFHLGNIEAKIAALKDYKIIIFDGEEIPGSPSAIPALADALKKFKIKYGYIEIVKQEGDKLLRKLMASEIVRVHSVPKDELIKISKEEAIDRFARGARERSVRLIYLRPFLPPQIDAYPVEYNLEYFKAVKARIEAAGLVIGEPEKTSPLTVKGWQVLLLGAGVLAGGLFLLHNFTPLPIWLASLSFFGALAVMFFLGTAGYSLLLQKGLAFAAALIFPSWAVIANFSGNLESGEYPTLKYGVLQILKVIALTGVGIFIMVGLLSDFRFMLGVESFPAVKAALILPILIVAAYFIFPTIVGLRSEGESRGERWRNVLNLKVSLGMVLLLGAGAVALVVLVARSGNFVLPVPAVEKYFRNWLELLLSVRPRTKEFLAGYPLLFVAALYYFKGKRDWLWLLAALGTIAPISVFNSFSHLHTPLLISLQRTFNGLVLGLLVGMGVGWFLLKMWRKQA